MIAKVSDRFPMWASLRNKITALAILPALVCSIIFVLLIWTTSRSTAKLVGAELTRFMAERTSRACIHGWNTSIVAYDYVMQTLEANMQTTRLLLEKSGGVHKDHRARRRLAGSQRRDPGDARHRRASLGHRLLALRPGGLPPVRSATSP